MVCCFNKPNASLRKAIRDTRTLTLHHSNKKYLMEQPFLWCGWNEYFSLTDEWKCKPPVSAWKKLHLNDHICCFHALTQIGFHFWKYLKVSQLSGKRTSPHFLHLSWDCGHLFWLSLVLLLTAPQPGPKIGQFGPKTVYASWQNAISQPTPPCAGEIFEKKF